MNAARGCVCLMLVLGSIMLRAQSAVPAGALENSGVILLGDRTARTLPNGGESRDLTRGMLATGEAVGMHDSMLPVGAMPNPPHANKHSEFIVVREGVLAFEHDGKAERAKPGDVIYVAMGTVHGVRNVGDVPARYLVIALGGDVKK